MRARGALKKVRLSRQVGFEIPLLDALEDIAVFLLAHPQRLVRLPLLVQGVLDVRPEDGEEAQHEDPCKRLEQVRAEQVLEEIGLRRQKKEHERFAYPVEAGDNDAGDQDRVHHPVVRGFLLHGVMASVEFIDEFDILVCIFSVVQSSKRVKCQNKCLKCLKCAKVLTFKEWMKIRRRLNNCCSESEMLLSDLAR